MLINISVLGALEVTRDGEFVPIPGGKTGELLVRLALDAGTFVRTDLIVEDLWAESAVTTRRNTLQSKVARLRRALGEPGVIVSGDGGYTLAVDPSDVDALSVLRDTAIAGDLLDAGEDRRAAERSASALGRFHGELLRGAGAWATPYRSRLDDARLELVETRFGARVQLGGAGDLIGELEAAVAAAPYREGLWELLITAQYRAGRQADALASGRRIRAILQDELGLDPGPRLQELERRILVQDVALGVGPRSTRRLEAHADVGNLPSLQAELIGRSAELESLLGLHGNHRLVEVVGPGGVGKTAVAIAAGRRLLDAPGTVPGGVWLARLETASTADEVLDTVIAALHVAGGQAALVERLRSTATVVILDNCEHVREAAAAVATRLLDAAPELRILCTSQVPLDVDGEAVLQLAPLPLHEAVDLFTRRAVRRNRSTPEEGDDAVEELCRALDGLPLAIELAAARTRTLSVAEIRRRLDDRFSVLSDPTSRRPERLRALRATIRWSYELLFPDDKRGLWALATFAGDAPLPALESVLEALEVPASASIDVIGRLASRSLLIVDHDGPSVRYRLLESIRAFALDAMAAEESSTQAFRAHAAWYADAAGRSTEGVRSPRQAEHLAFARAERANLDAALIWSSTHAPLLAVQIVTGFGWAWIVLGDSRGAQRILNALAAAGEQAPLHDVTSALLLAAWLEASTGRLEVARGHVAAAAHIALGLQDAELQARCSSHEAYIASHAGDFGLALELTDRSDALYEGLDRPWDQAANWLFAARAANSLGDRKRANEACDLVAEWLRSIDDPWLNVRHEATLGELARLEGRFADAVTHLGRAAETSGRLGFRQTEAFHVFSLGRAQCQAGDDVEGVATLQLALTKAEATGDLRLAALVRVHAGGVLRALGQPAAARAVLDEAAAWHRAEGGGEQSLLGECLLATLDAEAGIVGAAGRLLRILEQARRVEDAPVELLALDALDALGRAGAPRPRDDPSR
ncbi:MAG: transcriptional activator domain [Solirubrobacterales bacterium]|nr:transcriptional activator domain [Solirubrobacterales bacterium]